MIVVQTPLRISLFGGGTDFREFFAEEGGCVLGAAIDKYIFVTIKKRFDQMLRVGYTRTELVENVDQLQHELIREALRLTGLRNGIEITTMGDIPSAGSGLGSSSTVVVGALHAMYAYQNALVPAERLAEQACQIEIEILGKPIGIQDQNLAAFGGLRFLEFLPDGQVRRSPIKLAPAAQRQLNDSLMLFFTGTTRTAESILHEQQRNLNGRRGILREMKAIALTAREALEAGRLEVVGGLLHESWQLKKQLATRISNATLDAIYQAARQAGATGGKLTGAGGGGFLLLCCPWERQECVRAALAGLQELPFRFEPDGTKVIFNYRR